nr:hypothetical protein [Actinomycetales bacterium]
MTLMAGNTAVRGLPAIDEITARRAVFVTGRREVTLSAALAQFLATAEFERLRPVLVTGPGAAIGPFVNWEMRRLGGSWVVQYPDGSLLDALRGRPLLTLDELDDPRVVAAREPVPLSDHTDASPVAVMAVELLTAHRPTAELVVGEGPEAVLDGLALDGPDVWGSTEPLTLRWDRGELTRTARTQMPVSSTFRAASPGGARATLRFEHNPEVLLERLTMMIPLEPYAKAAPGFSARAEDLLEELHERHAVVTGTISLIDGDAGGRLELRRRRPEVPQAVLVGSWGLHQAGVDPGALEGHPGVRVLGGRWAPALLASFDSAHGAPWRQFQELSRAAGLDGILRSFGIGGEAQ